MRQIVYLLSGRQVLSAWLYDLLTCAHLSPAFRFALQSQLVSHHVVGLVNVFIATKSQTLIKKNKQKQTVDYRRSRRLFGGDSKRENN